MKPYKIKHIPTGLYYQPRKHRGSNLSKRGKVYQTGTHGLCTFFKDCKKGIARNFSVQCEKESQIHKTSKNILVWFDCKWSYNQIIADTKFEDWIIEEV